jgi:hypothetical protein
MLGGDKAPQVSPDGIVSDRLTVPLKRFSPAIVMVEMADWAESTGPGVVAETVKSRNWNRAVAE